MRVLQVGELSSLIRAAVEEVPDLQDAYVEAELGDCHLSAAGHWYFSLKDARPGQASQAALRAVMFSSKARSLAFQPASGMRVIAHGQVSFYLAQGSLQFYMDRLEPQGVGALALALQQLLQRLEAEGLFAEERKRPLPFLPRRLAVVTSTRGAALRDVLHVVRRRCPIVEVLVCPTAVQGEGAVEEIVNALELAGRSQAEVVLLVRGGGSLEDLRAFNSEEVARAVASCPRPVVAGVGHETDSSVVDYVADRRAPTPSVAAELAVPDLGRLVAEVARRRDRLWRVGRGGLGSRRRDLSRIAGRLGRMAPRLRLANSRLDLDRRQAALTSAWRRLLTAERRALETRSGLLAARGPRPRLAQAQEEFRGRVGRLEALSPLAVLGRGYSITLGPDGRGVLRRATEVEVGQVIRSRLHHGSVRSRVEEVEEAADGG